MTGQRFIVSANLSSGWDVIDTAQAMAREGNYPTQGEAEERARWLNAQPEVGTAAGEYSALRGKLVNLEATLDAVASQLGEAVAEIDRLLVAGRGE